MGMYIQTDCIQAKKDAERKIRILKSLIKADIAKKDTRSLVYHRQALEMHEKALAKITD